ncbi:hypothetical protein AVEN_194618-1 [Araneus ventricosus]|uniref:Uncharacterized protein n=1 Tax=Araneus ventricosus TaxID=182803 RepID=A0A4Y2A934_ARAVE|nr:hypothetical protein AVEN_194618-1 [Araneus ventricosus]
MESSDPKSETLPLGHLENREISSRDGICNPNGCDMQHLYQLVYAERKNSTGTTPSVRLVRKRLKRNALTNSVNIYVYRQEKKEQMLSTSIYLTISATVN